MISITKNRVFAVLIIGAITVVTVGWIAAAYRKAETAKELAVTRRWAGLAPLPSGASDVRVVENSTLTWTGYYLRFVATPQQINAFIALSPGLRGKSAEIFSPAHQYLPAPDRKLDMSDPKVAANSYFFEAPWFDRAVRQSGRRYIVSWQGNFGELVVNDANHTVYIYVADS